MAQLQQQQPDKKQPGSVTPRADVAPALPHEPDVFPGAVDVVGVLPDDVHVDPDITEGHPGYEESGRSEIKPPKPLSAGTPR